MRALVLLVLLAACGTTRLLAVPVGLDTRTLAVARDAAAATLGQPGTAAFRDLHGFAYSDGTIAVCGDMRGRDAFGVDWGFAPVYVRIRGSDVLRVHVDDTTGYGPALVACTRADEGLARGRLGTAITAAPEPGGTAIFVSAIVPER